MQWQLQKNILSVQTINQSDQCYSVHGPPASNMVGFCHVKQLNKNTCLSALLKIAVILHRTANKLGPKQCAFTYMSSILL